MLQPEDEDDSYDSSQRERLEGINEAGYKFRNHRALHEFCDLIENFLRGTYMNPSIPVSQRNDATRSRTAGLSHRSVVNLEGYRQVTLVTPKRRANVGRQSASLSPSGNKTPFLLSHKDERRHEKSAQVDQAESRTPAFYADRLMQA
ncbi:hypothetical protein [Sporisorium scitamineum]|uniref:Uncharacterized protein n=1 Tax=Sporisorium scitamineum TaxID=49012 RepID=A0A0F7RS32_9BASI|nr:hypothetical protein [Sporisorium scitamineum]